MDGRLVSIAAVFVGGGVGSVLRYAVSMAALAAFERKAAGAARIAGIGGTFPFGTLAVNSLGSAAIGFAGAWLLATTDGRADGDRFWLRSLVMVGLLGGFTTYSAFALETLRLAQAGRGLSAAAYVGLTNALAFGGAAAGWWLGSILRGVAGGTGGA